MILAPQDASWPDLAPNQLRCDSGRRLSFTTEYIMAMRFPAAAVLSALLIWTLQTASANAADFEVLDDPAQVDELAANVQKTSNSLCWELHRYHRDKPDFIDAYKQAKEVWEMSGTLRDALR